MEKLEILREEVLKCARLLCDAEGLDLVELNLRAYNKVVAIQLLVDLPTGGVGIGECSRLNARLDKELYEGLKIGDDYTLEVSSPGLDRPLTVFPDFRRSIGRKVRLFLRERISGKMEVVGTIQGVRDSEVILGTQQGDLLIGIEKIEKGKQIII